MTRQAMVQASAAGVAPPATDTRASMVTIAADRVATSRVQSRLCPAQAQRSGLSASPQALPSSGRANADISRKSKSP